MSIFPASSRSNLTPVISATFFAFSSERTRAVISYFESLEIVWRTVAPMRPVYADQRTIDAFGKSGNVPVAPARRTVAGMFEGGW